MDPSPAHDTSAPPAHGPDFIIIGAMKSATSTLYAQLAAQPGVFMSTPKEPCFFSDDDVWANGIGWYQNLFAAAAPGDVRGEASTHYTKLPTYPRTVERMVEHIAHARLVYVMRHPVDRLVSHLVHARSEGQAPDRLDDALESVEGLVDYGRYAAQLRPYLEAFGSDSIMPIAFERVNATAGAQVLDEILTFVGSPRPDVAWTSGDDRHNAGAERLRPGVLRDHVIRNPLLTTIRRALVPEALRRRIAARFTVARLELSESERARLATLFDPDLAELGELLGLEGLDCATWPTLMSAGPLGWAVHA